MTIVPRRENDATRTYVSFVDDIALLPPPPPNATDPQQNIVSDATLGQIALGANILITTIIVIAMMIDGSQARTAIIVGSLYFAASTVGFAIVTTGGLAAIINTYQHQRTERQRVSAYRELGTLALMWRIEVERNRRLEIAPAGLPPSHRDDVGAVGGAHRVSPLNSYVEPYADQERAAIEAIRWAEKLYDSGGIGAPDRRKVQLDGDSIGRLKIRMIGSKRGAGSREAGVWLIEQGVIVRVAGGYALRVDRFPYRHYLSTIAPPIA